MNPSPGPWRRGVPLALYQEGAPESEETDTDAIHDANNEQTGIALTDYAYQKLHKEPYGDNLALILAAPEMREMLLKLEWSGCSEGYGECDAACPVCVAVETAYVGDPRVGCGQHNVGCALGALLERIR